MRIKGLINSLSCVILLSTLSCAWEQVEPQIDCSTSPVEMELIASNGTACGASSGGFTVDATGGEAPYSYTSEIGNNIDGVFENVSAGWFNITATDAKGCTVELIVSIVNLNGVNIDDVVITNAGCDSNNGVIQISPSGGEEPYTYSIDGGATQGSSVFAGLDRGTYLTSVIDQVGCEITKAVKISSGISYANSIKGIIENSCAISGCHNGSVSPNFTSFSNIQARASSIKSRTASGSMPRGSTLSQSQIDMIACWVEDGALDN